MIKKFVWWLAVLAVTIGFAPNVYAFFETYGAGSRARAMGGAFTAVADDFSAAFYNPAGLAQSTGHKFTLEYLYAKPDLKVKDSEGNDFQAFEVTGRLLYDPVDGYSGSPDVLAPILGIEMDVNEIVQSVLKLPFNIQLGILAGIPDNGTKGWEMVPDTPDIPHFISYGDVANHMNAHMSLSVELMEGLLYAGAGGMLTLSCVADLVSPHAYSETTSMTVLHGKLSADLGLDLQFGLLVTPFDKMVRAGVAYKQETFINLDPLQVLAQIPLGGNVLPIALITDSDCSYRPEEFDFGLALEFEKLPLTDMFPLPFKSLLVSMDVAYQKWGEFDYCRTYKFQLDTEQNPQLIETQITPIDFDDTIEFKVGMVYTMNENIAGMVGFQQFKSPVPDQSQRLTNYLDMDRNEYSVGGTYSFTDIPVTLSGAVSYSVYDGFYVDNEGVVGLAWGDQESFEVQDGSVLTISLGGTFSF